MEGGGADIASEPSPTPPGADKLRFYTELHGTAGSYIRYSIQYTTTPVTDT